MIICIGREFGSGGHEIGKIIAEKLGMELYDRDLIDKAAEKIVAMPKEVLEKADEKKHNPWLHQVWYDVPNQELNGMTANDTLHQAYSSIIRELAEKEPCVIVGRCADFILQDRTDCLKVFVHADMKFRADRIVRVYGEREKSPEARLKEKDKRRAAYYRFYTDMKWGDVANYHVALDSGVIGIEKCAKVIESLA